VFERFTRDARRAVVRAQEAAGRMGAEQVEPEHLLLALAEGCNPASRAIAEAGLDPATIAAAIEADLVAMLEVVGVPPSVVESAPARPRADVPPLSLHAKSVLEHALLGALRPPGPTLARVLARHDVAPERLAALVQVEVAAGRR